MTPGSNISKETIRAPPSAPVPIENVRGLGVEDGAHATTADPGAWKPRLKTVWGEGWIERRGYTLLIYFVGTEWFFGLFHVILTYWTMFWRSLTFFFSE